MRNTLLTTTALVLTAGIASADGHASVSWSGTATAGVARQGAVQAVKSAEVKTTDAATVAADWAALNTAATTKFTDTALAGTTVAGHLALIATERAVQVTALATNVALSATKHALVGSGSNAATRIAAQVAKVAADVLVVNHTANIAAIDAYKIAAGITAAAAAGKAGDFQTYSEVNATVTGTVTAGDVTMTAAMSVDAGEGYTFASDKTFDTAKAGAGVNLDNITIATSMGTFKLDQNAIAHLVDAGDDDTADILYTNTFGTMSVSVAIDANKDSDDKAVRGGITRTNKDGDATLAGEAGDITIATAVAADVNWSAKVSMPLGSGSAYVAMDEEGGNIFGAAATLGGVGLTFSSKLEALEEEESKDRDNSIGATYVVGATTLGATWNSVEDKDQWGVSAAYSADGITLNASTDEGSDWSVSGSYLMGTGASVVGGVNYTEDAYLGLSFSF